MPEAKCSIGCASHEASETWLVLELLSLFGLGKSKLESFVDDLNVVDCTVVREESTHHLDLFKVLVVPKEYHVVAVNCQEA